jgi:hypothetical protein
MGFKAGKWMELAQDHVQWRTLILAIIKLLVSHTTRYYVGRWEAGG